MKILLLEDDAVLLTTLQIFLERNGYSVDLASSLEEAEDLSYENSYDLYLFDINLPIGNGLDLLKSLRYAEDETPTIFITALTDIHSMTKGFNLGAMDYIKKPFDPEELLLRIHAKFQQKTLSYNDIVFDADAKVLRKNGTIIHIGNVQEKVFMMLLKNQGKLVSKNLLYECLEHPSSTALRVAITKIKQRLDIDVINIRAKGYMIEKI